METRTPSHLQLTNKQDDDFLKQTPPKQFKFMAMPLWAESGMCTLVKAAEF